MGERGGLSPSLLADVAGSQVASSPLSPKLWHNDLLRNERAYVGELSTLQELFLKDLLFDSKLSKPMLLPVTRDMPVFLGALEDIRTLNSSMLKELEMSSSPKAALGLISRYAPLFKIYTQYVSKHDVMVNALLRAEAGGGSGSGSGSSGKKASEAFRKWLEERKQDSRWKVGQPPLAQLRSLLVLPLDRLDYYIRTLRQLHDGLDESQAGGKGARGTNAGHGGNGKGLRLQEVDEAVEALMATQEHIRAHKDAETQKVVLNKLEEQWGGHRLASLGRRLVKEGDLVKVSRRADIPYRFLLFSDVLVYGSEVSSGPSPTWQHHRTLALATMQVNTEDAEQEGDKASRTFTVVGPEKSFAVMCKSVDERNAWIHAIATNIQRAKEEAEGDAGFEEEDALGHAPVWKQDHSTHACRRCDKRFGVLLRRRHHCRKCGELFCHECCKAVLPMSSIVPGNASSALERVCDGCFKSLTEGSANVSFTTEAEGEIAAGEVAEGLDGCPPSIADSPGGRSNPRLGSTGSMTGTQGLKTSASPAVLRSQTSSSSILSASSFSPSRPPAHSKTTKRSTSALAYTTAVRSPAHQKAVDMAKRLKEESNTPSVNGGKGRRQRVLEEIFTTEDTYVRNLETLLQVYVQPLLHDSTSRNPTLGRVCLLSSADKLTSMSVFLHSVEHLYTLNTQLLASLAHKMLDWDPSSSTIGDVFSQFAPLFTLYSHYTDSQEFASKTIADCCSGVGRDAAAFRELAEFIAKADGQQREGNQNLQSLLIMPIQRVPRYVMLLQEYLKQTQKDAPEHADVALVQEALAKVREAASHINDVIRQRQNKERILQLASNWIGGFQFIAANRRLLKEGKLLKQCRRGLKEFDFVLLTDVLVYGQQASSSAASSAALGGFTSVPVLFHREIPLDQCAVMEDASDETIFQVLSTRKTFLVRAKSSSERASWVEALMKAMAAYRPSAPSLSSTSSAPGVLIRNNSGLDSSAGTDRFAAAWAPDAQSRVCTLCSRSFSLLLRRHHCRVCGALVCDGCSPHRLRVDYIDAKRDVRVCHSCRDKNMLEEVAEGDEAPTPRAPQSVRGATARTPGRGSIFSPRQSPRPPAQEKPAEADVRKEAPGGDGLVLAALVQDSEASSSVRSDHPITTAEIQGQEDDDAANKTLLEAEEGQVQQVTGRLANTGPPAEEEPILSAATWRGLEEEEQGASTTAMLRTRRPDEAQAMSTLREWSEGATWRGREEPGATTIAVLRTRRLDETQAASSSTLRDKREGATWRGGEERGGSTIRFGASARQQHNATMRLVLTQEFKKMADDCRNQQVEDSEEEEEEEEDVSEDDEEDEEQAADEQRGRPTKPQQLALANHFIEPRHVLYQEPPSPPVDEEGMGIMWLLSCALKGQLFCAQQPPSP